MIFFLIFNYFFKIIKKFKIIFLKKKLIQIDDPYMTYMGDQSIWVFFKKKNLILKFLIFLKIIKKLTFLKEKLMQIIDPYESYRLTIHMDHQFVWVFFF